MRLHPRDRGLENCRGLGEPDTRHRLERLETRAHDARRREEARLGEAVHHLRAHALEARQSRATGGALLLLETALLLELSLALDVHAEPGQLGRQALVLPPVARGDRALIVWRHRDNSAL